MRILVLGSYLNRQYAGTAHATINIANALAGSGWAEAVVYGYEIDRAALSDRLETIEGAKPEELRFFWRFPSLFAIRQTWLSLKGIRLPAVDACYTRSTVMGLAYRKLFPDTRLLSHTGHILPGREYLEETSGSSRSARIEAQLADRLERRAYAAPSWDHIVSTRLVAEQRAAYYRLPETFFNVCPLGVDFTRFDRSCRYEDMRAVHGIPREAFVVVTVTRLLRWKNLDLALRAIAGAAAQPWMFVVGSGEAEASLRRLSEELGIADRVVFTGHADPRPYLASSDLFVLPSSIESFGNAYAEAMAMGVPCIGLRNHPPAVLSSALDVIGDGDAGYCVSDAGELQSRIDELAKDRGLLRRMSEAAYQRARSLYTTDRYVNHLHQLLTR